MDLTCWGTSTLMAAVSSLGVGRSCSHWARPSVVAQLTRTRPLSYSPQMSMAAPDWSRISPARPSLVTASGQTAARVWANFAPPISSSMASTTRPATL